MKKRSFGTLILCVVAVALGLGTTARAETQIEKTFALRPGGQFILDSDAGSVTVMGSNSPGAKVVVTSNRDDFNNLFTSTFDGGSSEVRITVRRKEKFNWPHHLNVHFEVQVPASTRLEVRTGGGGITTSNLRGDQKLNTSGGGIEVSWSAGNLTARTSGGGIRLREVDGNADINTSGGGIEVLSLQGSLVAHTSGGGIHIDGVSGHVDAHTSGGPIEAAFARGDSQGGVLETSGGSIRVALDPSVNLDLDAATSGGSVSSDLPLNKVVGKISSSSLHGSLGSGGSLLRLRTSGGSIRITSRTS